LRWAVRWPKAAKAALIAQIVSHWRILMSPGLRRVWEILAAGPVIKTTPVALKPAGFRMNFTVLLRLFDRIITSFPEFLRPYLMDMANLIFPGSLYHYFFRLILEG
jgi:hypothetical protein